MQQVHITFDSKKVEKKLLADKEFLSAMTNLINLASNISSRVGAEVSDDFCGDCSKKFMLKEKKVYQMQSAIFGEIYPKDSPAICDDCANKRYEQKRIEVESKNFR